MLVTSQFSSDLESVLEVVALYKCQIVFKIRVDRDNNSQASSLRDILNSFNCVQHVPHEPTHRDGGMSDLVITKSEQKLDSIAVDPPAVLSDHSLITWSLPLAQQPPVNVTCEVWGWQKLDKNKFSDALLVSRLCNDTLSEAPDELLQMFQIPSLSG